VPDPLTLSVLCALGFVAGLVDAVGGGGGLIQAPALFVGLPSLPVPTVLGTNKLAGIFGTSAAAATYARRVPMDWGLAAAATAAAGAASYAGAHFVQGLSREAFRPFLLVMLVVMGAYTVWKKDLGAYHREGLPPWARRALGAVVGAAVGFYDGFFGPGGGSLYVFGLVALAGLDFLRASATAKLMNVASAVLALIVFVAAGHVHVGVALPMAACNLAGGVTGAHLATRRGNAFVRALFLLVVALLVARLTWEVIGDR
jgi:uncharacterized membrane protein YfcA